MKYNTFLLKILMFVFGFILFTNISFAEEIKIAIEPDKEFTTMRAQSFVGKWQIQMYKKTATESYVIKEEITTGEDSVLMLIPKGFIVRMSSEKNLDEGYDKIVITGGELLSVEFPGLTPKILQGRLEITHDNSKIYVVNTLPIKDYIISCASSEVITCETEAVKAHIIALETRVHYLKNNSKHPKEDFDLCDKSHCIKYSGTAYNRELIELLYNSISNHLLYYKDKLIFPRYHHTCAGKISSAKDVYGVDEPYHIAHNDIKDNKGSENCFHSPSFHWTVEIQLSSIPDFLSLEFAGGADNIFLKTDPIKINSDGRILMVRILGKKVKELSGIDFMLHLQNFYGYNCFKSMRYSKESLRRTMLIRGMGEGDGVGMCLYGADGLAKKGMSYKDILEFYYPGTTIK